MLVAERLAKAYRGVQVVRDVDLRLEPGRIVGLVGANGAGKSTTIKMLTGLVHPTSGTALMDGLPTTDPKARARMGYLPEDSPLYEDLDAMSLLGFFGALYGVRRKESERRGGEVLDRLGLEEKHWRGKPIGTMSKGMTRKVAIARTLLHDPDVLLLDEPTSGLDPLTVREMGHFFTELGQSGKAVLLSAHNLLQVEEVCDEILIMHNGTIMARGTLNELHGVWGETRYHVRATHRFPASVPQGPIHQATFTSWADAEAAMQAVRQAGGTVLEVESEPPRLDQILARVAGI